LRCPGYQLAARGSRRPRRGNPVSFARPAGCLSTKIRRCLAGRFGGAVSRNHPTAGGSQRSVLVGSHGWSRVASEGLRSNSFAKIAADGQADSEDSRMLFAPDDEVCGVPVAVALAAVRLVESVQWCSAGWLAREFQMTTVASLLLLEELESDGCLDRHLGMLPPGHDGAWLPEEEAGEEPLVLWHLTYPKGKALAKARIGPAMPRAVAEKLLADFLGRIRTVNNDPGGSHTIERVILYGSLTDSSRSEVSDIDLLIYARRRARDAYPGSAPGGTAAQDGLSHRTQPSADEAVYLRMKLEALLRGGDERLGASVVDESSDNPHPLPPGAVEIEVFPDEPRAWRSAGRPSGTTAHTPNQAQ
jgi:hypothetical protein